MSKLTIYYSTTFLERNGDYYCNGAFGRYVEELSKEYEFINLCVPVNKASSVALGDYKITSKNILIQEMPDYKNVIGSIKYMYKSLRKLMKFAKEWEENVYIRWPSPYSYMVFLIAKHKNLKTIVHIVGDSRSVVEGGSKYRGFIKHIAISYAKFEDFLLKKIMKKSINIANGTGMRRIYSGMNINVNEIRTSTILNKDIYEREKNISKNKDIKILYVGYLRQEKGISYLLEAINILKSKIDKPITLTIVGDGEERTNLENLVIDLNLKENVDFKGHMPLGDKLFEIYRNNSIFILPSISEGTPRVLIEAMANGLSIVATKVGGIPFTISDKYNGLLINPYSSNDIADSIIKLENNPKTREVLIKNGYEFAKLNTLESHVNEIIKIIEGDDFYEKKAFKYN
ncbi:MAG: glycosyltransferase [Paeniclostridium sordellii]|nr:glycosyltransferase [Paeniclostridium sordellii]